MCCNPLRMGMISSRHDVLSRTSRTGGQSNRRWGSKAIRIGHFLEDSSLRTRKTALSAEILLGSPKTSRSISERNSRKIRLRCIFRRTLATSRNLPGTWSGGKPCQAHRPGAVNRAVAGGWLLVRAVRARKEARQPRRGENEDDGNDRQAEEEERGGNDLRPGHVPAPIHQRSRCESLARTGRPARCGCGRNR